MSLHLTVNSAKIIHNFMVMIMTVSFKSILNNMQGFSIVLLNLILIIGLKDLEVVKEVVGFWMLGNLWSKLQGIVRMILKGLSILKGLLILREFNIGGLLIWKFCLISFCLRKSKECQESLNKIWNRMMHKVQRDRRKNSKNIQKVTFVLEQNKNWVHWKMCKK